MGKKDVNIAHLTAKNSKYKRALNDTEESTKRSAGKISKSWSGVSATIAKVAGSIYLANKAFNFLSESYSLYLDQVKSEAKVAQAIKQTGGAAGLTAEELKKMASALQEVTGIGDEKILNDVTAQLLTFKSVTGDVFKRAQELALDISSVIGTDMKSATIQLGKVLEDPVGQMGALSRNGIIFSDTQKEIIKDLVKQGKIQEAQVVILDEIDKLYGGQAKAINEATGGIQGASAAWGDFKEALGRAFAPLVNEIIPVITKAVKGWGIILNKLLGIEEKIAVTYETKKQYYDAIKNYNKDLLETEKKALRERLVDLSIKIKEREIMKLTLEEAQKEAAITHKRVGTVLEERKQRKAQLVTLRYEYDLLKSQLDIASDINKARGIYEQFQVKNNDQTDNEKEKLFVISDTLKVINDKVIEIKDNWDGIFDGVPKKIKGVEGEENPGPGGQDEAAAITDLYENAEAMSKFSYFDGLTASMEIARAAVDGFFEDLYIKAEWANSMLEKAFVGMANAFISQVQRMISQWLAFQFLRMGFSLFGIPLPEAPIPRASGGPVLQRQPYVVGERGPELFLPSTSGVILPNNVYNNFTNTNMMKDSNIVSGINKLNQNLTNLTKRIEAYNRNVSMALNSMPPITLKVDGREIAKVAQSGINKISREGANMDEL